MAASRQWRFRVALLTAAVSFPVRTAIAQPAEAARPEAAVQPTPPQPTPPAPPAKEEGQDLQARLRAQSARPGGLTSEEVGKRAAATSLRARAREQEVLAAAAAVDKALIATFPRLTLIGRYTRLSPIDEPSFGPGQGSFVVTDDGTEGPLPPGQGLIGVPLSAFSFPTILNQYHLQANLSVPLSDYLLRTRQGIAAARHSRASAEVTARAARLQDAADAKTIYYGWVRARLQQIVAEQSLEQARAHWSATKVAFQAGWTSQADILGAESRVATAELLVDRARNLVVLIEEQLRTVTHDTRSAPYQIGEDINSRARRADRNESFEQLFAEACRRRLELRALDENLRSLRNQRSVVAAGEWPRLEAFGNAYYANPNPRYQPQEERWRATWDVGVQVTWSPNDYGSTAADARGYGAQVARLEAERRAMEDGLRAEVLQAHQSRQEARSALRTTARGLAAAEEAYRVRCLLFEHGRATSVEVIDAETNLLGARLEQVNAQVNLLVARVRLDHAVGRDAAATSP